MSIESGMPFNHLILCHPLLLLPLIFPSIRIFSNEWVGVSASASVLPKNIQDWFPLGLTDLISLQSKVLLSISSFKLFKFPFYTWLVQNHKFKIPLDTFNSVLAFGLRWNIFSLPLSLSAFFPSSLSSCFFLFLFLCLHFFVKLNIFIIDSSEGDSISNYNQCLQETIFVPNKLLKMEEFCLLVSKRWFLSDFIEENISSIK